MTQQRTVAEDLREIDREVERVRALQAVSADKILHWQRVRKAFVGRLIRGIAASLALSLAARILIGLSSLAHVYAWAAKGGVPLIVVGTACSAIAFGAQKFKAYDRGLYGDFEAGAGFATIFVVLSEQRSVQLETSAILAAIYFAVRGMENSTAGSNARIAALEAVERDAREALARTTEASDAVIARIDTLKTEQDRTAA